MPTFMLSRVSRHYHQLSSTLRNILNNELSKIIQDGGRSNSMQRSFIDHGKSHFKMNYFTQHLVWAMDVYDNQSAESLAQQHANTKLKYCMFSLCHYQYFAANVIFKIGNSTVLCRVEVILTVVHCTLAGEIQSFQEESTQLGIWRKICARRFHKGFKVGQAKSLGLKVTFFHHLQ